MPSIRSLVSKHFAHRFKLVAIILLLDKIMFTCSRCTEKGLVYIAIIALLSYQPSSCIKCTKLNMRSSCNIRLVSNTKYAFLARLYTY